MTSIASRAELFLSTLIILALVTMSSCQVPQTNPTGVGKTDQTADRGPEGASLLEGGRNPSFSLKERFRWAIEAFDKPHSREKRTAFFTVKFPFNTQLQIKWSLAIPVPAESKYKTKLSLAIPITMNLPRYLVDDPYTPAFSNLFNDFREGADAIAKEEEEEEEKENEVDRRKRDLHVKERMELYDNVEMMMDSYGLPGKECLLRTVCELAEAPLSYGVLGDFLNTISCSRQRISSGHA